MNDQQKIAQLREALDAVTSLAVSHENQIETEWGPYNDDCGLSKEIVQAQNALAATADDPASAAPVDERVMCGDCIGQGIDTDPPEDGFDDTCKPCGGTGFVRAALDHSAIAAKHEAEVRLPSWYRWKVPGSISGHFTRTPNASLRSTYGEPELLYSADEWRERALKAEDALHRMRVVFYRNILHHNLCSGSTHDEIAAWIEKACESVHVDGATTPPVAPSVAKCQQCGMCSVDNCNDFGCGFLEAGNGEPVAPSVAVPDGWQLVPTVASAPMLTAIFNQLWAVKCPSDLGDAYTRMLTCAPTPPAPASAVTVPYGYIVQSPDGRETYLNVDPTGYRGGGFPELGFKVIDLYTAPTPPAPVAMPQHPVGAGDNFGPTKDGCCGSTVTKRCDGCPYSAPPAPVAVAKRELTDAVILREAEDSGITWMTDERRPDNITIIDFARAIAAHIAGGA